MTKQSASEMPAFVPTTVVKNRARRFAAAPGYTSPPPAWAEGATPAPFAWDEARRARLRAERDALYATCTV